MALRFPDNPTIGTKLTVGNNTWEYTGNVWERLGGGTGATGSTGDRGSTGATGATGATGPVGDFVEFLNGATGSITTEGLTFAFAGISVGASGITVDGDIRLVSGAIGFTTDVDIFVGGDNVNLARFSRTNSKVTFGDINGESTSVPTFFELDTKGRLVSVTGGVFFPANGISLGVGLTFPDGSFQSSAHAPHEFVASFNGLTGAISTTALTLEVAGISASGGITTQGGLANISSTNTFRVGKPGSGIGSGPFAPQTYSFPTTIVAAGGGLGGDVDPTLLANQSVGIAFAGDTPLEFIKLSKFTVKSFNSVTGDVEGVNSFNGLTGAVVTDTLTLPCAGISGPSAITFDNGEVIRNSPDGSIQIIPSDEGGNHFGIEIDATEWGFGPVVNVIDESGTQVTKAIRLDTDVVMSNTNVPDGTPATIFFNNASDRGMAQNSNGDGTIGMGVNGNNGHFAVINKFHLDSSNRSMSASDKTALGMTNPQFLVYSADANDANDYVRIEHDKTDANIFSGNGDINLIAAGGDVGLSGGNLVNVGTISANTITDRGDGVGINISGSNDPIAITASSGLISLKGGGGIKFTTDHDDPFIFQSEFSVSPTNNIMFDTGNGQFLDVRSDMHMQIGDLDSVTSNTKVNIDPASGGSIEMTTGGTIRETFDSTYRRNTDVATFTVNASSAIATGTKTNSLYRIPYDATLTNFDVKVSGSGGFTAAVYVAGSNFGDPLTGRVTGCSLGVQGVTGSSTVFNTPSVTAGNFLFLDIFSNASGSTGAQAFLTFESR
jgi:hypothetical protein